MYGASQTLRLTIIYPWHSVRGNFDQYLGAAKIGGIVTTATQIISRAYRMAGVLASGETPCAEMANDGLVYLNGVLDALSNENLAIYTDVLDELPLTGADAYTYGPDGVSMNQGRRR